MYVGMYDNLNMNGGCKKIRREVAIGSYVCRNSGCYQCISNARTQCAKIESLKSTQTKICQNVCWEFCQLFVIAAF